jgi:glutathionylspermidine synthase
VERIKSAERPDWHSVAEELGFRFHTPGGEPYWREDAYYAFSLNEIEGDLEDPSAELEQMCFAVVERACKDEEVLERLKIPRNFWDYIQQSWKNRARNLYGRMDFSYSGIGGGPAKLLEYNADTPTALYEAAVFQWRWLEDLQKSGQLPGTADQFNSIHETLIEAFEAFGIEGPLHLACEENSEEDLGTIEYLADCAEQAGLSPYLLPISAIGLTDLGGFVDGEDRSIYNLFKLYPWEWIWKDEFAAHLQRSRMKVIEPPWKAILSNKGLLPYLWELEPGHPNLLPAFFEDAVDGEALGSNFVRKPLFSREGANIEIFEDGRSAETAGGPYGAEGAVVQALSPLPSFDGMHPVMGVWLVASRPVGLGIREDVGRITTDDSRFVPHVILE